jgi:hypothetical protein
MFYVTDRWVALTKLEKCNSEMNAKWIRSWAEEWEKTRAETNKLLKLRRNALREREVNNG